MTKEVIGYLPDERPPIGKLLLYALQQVIVMFPATVTVALIMASRFRQQSLQAVLRLYALLSSRAENFPFITVQASHTYLQYQVFLQLKVLRRLTAFFQQKEFRLHSLVSFFPALYQ